MTRVIGGVKAVGLINTDGASLVPARRDHQHGHGQQTDPSMHAAANASEAGFLSHIQHQRLHSVSPQFPMPPVRRPGQDGTSEGGRLVRRWMPAPNNETQYMGYPMTPYPGGALMYNNFPIDYQAIGPDSTPYMSTTRGIYGASTEAFPYDPAKPTGGGFSWGTRFKAVFSTDSAEDAHAAIGLSRNPFNPLDAGSDWGHEEQHVQLFIKRRGYGIQTAITCRQSGLPTFYHEVVDYLGFVGFYAQYAYFSFFGSTYWRVIFDLVIRDPLHWDSPTRNPGVMYRFWPYQPWQFVEIPREAFPTTGRLLSRHACWSPTVETPSASLYVGPTILENSNGDESF